MTVRPTLTRRGLLRCPHCSAEVATPVAFNPYRGCREKMLLLGGGTTTCPVCGVGQYIDPLTAERHNRHWFPKDFDPLRN